MLGHTWPPGLLASSLHLLWLHEDRMQLSKGPVNNAVTHRQLVQVLPSFNVLHSKQPHTPGQHHTPLPCQHLLYASKLAPAPCACPRCSAAALLCCRHNSNEQLSGVCNLRLQAGQCGLYLPSCTKFCMQVHWRACPQKLHVCSKHLTATVSAVNRAAAEH